MKAMLEPSPSTAATVHPSCPPSWACDTPDGKGVGAFGVFVIVVCGLLLLAAVTNRRKS